MGGCERKKLPAETSWSFELQNEYRFAYAIFTTSPPSSSWDYCAWIEGGQLELWILKIRYENSRIEVTDISFLSHFFLPENSERRFRRFLLVIFLLLEGLLQRCIVFPAIESRCVQSCREIYRSWETATARYRATIMMQYGGWKNIFLSFLSFRRMRIFCNNKFCWNSIAIMLRSLFESKEMEKFNFDFRNYEKIISYLRSISKSWNNCKNSREFQMDRNIFLIG